MENIKAIWLLLIVTFFMLIILFASNFFLSTEELIFNFYSEQLSQYQIGKIIENQNKWGWLSYATVPLLLLFRSSLVSLCLSIGNFFYSMNEVKIPKFNNFFQISLKGEFVLLLVGYFKFGYFYFFKTDYTLQDLQRYYPLSFINFLNFEKLEPWLIYPLQTINLFEITYFFVLVYGMYRLLNYNYWKSFEITSVSYGTGLIIWLGLVMFLTLNLS
jgi:hypothetical protein